MGSRTQTDVSALLSFYLACIEEEDRRSLQVSANPKFGQFTIPPGEPGDLFRGGSEICWEPKGNDRRFIERYSFALEKQRFLYGYPLFLDYQDYVSPLFFSEAELSFDEKNNQARIHLSHPSNVQVNLHLFRKTHQMLLERLDLQDFLEAPDFGTIEARISAALEKLGVFPPEIPKIAKPKGQKGWKNSNLLFRDVGAGFTAHLRRELSDLKERVPEMSQTALTPLLRTSSLMSSSAARMLEIAPLNPSQREAIGSALSQPLTVITGPPGTGKSQIVLSMLASLGAENLPVMFASKNNQAVDVVRQRLAALLGEADWYLRLGNKTNIDDEMSSKIDEATKLAVSSTKQNAPSGEELTDAVTKRNAIENDIKDRAALVDKYIAIRRKERSVLSALSNNWLDWILEGNSADWITKKTERSLIRHLPDVQAFAGTDWPGLWLWLKQFMLGSRILRGYQDFLIEIISGCYDEVPGWSSVDELSWEILAKDFSDLDALRRHRNVNLDKEKLWQIQAGSSSGKELKKSLDTASRKLQKVSLDIARELILGRLNKKSIRLPTLIKKYWELTQKAANLTRQASANIQSDFGRSAKQLLEVVPGVIVTSLSARRSLPLEPGLFECVIIDEASQCDIASAIPLLFRAKRLVVIGDPKQLRHISSIKEQTEQKIASEQKATKLLGQYSYRTKSLYDCAAETLEVQGGAPYFLEEHYRSHPDIIEFSNRVYYQRRLILRTEVEAESEQAIFWHDVPSKTDGSRGSLVNHKEVQVVRELVSKIIGAPSFEADWTIGIITPYRKQRDNLEKALAGDPGVRKLGRRLTIGTVHTFQGAEAHIIVFSPVVTNGVKPRAAEWISKEEGLLNVALTRARRALHIVGNKSFCQETPGPLGDLAKFVSQRDGVAHVARTGNPIADLIRESLQELGLWYQEEVPEATSTRTYYLDFLVVGLSGTRYDIEIDGRQHFFSAEAIAEDDVRDSVLTKSGYKVLRLRASELVKDPEGAKQLLASLM